MELPRVSPRSSDSWLRKGWQSLRDIAQEKPRDSFFESRVQHSDELTSQNAFRQARERLLRPSGWQALGPKWAAARFEVKGADTRQDSTVRQGDLLKIQLPGLPTANWVQVESVQDEPNRVEVRVRPTAAPGKDGVDHIFGQATTNTFTLQREGDEVVARVEGKDEVPNFTGPWWEDLLSATFLWGGWMGGKDHQWQPFVHNLLRGPARVD